MGELTYLPKRALFYIITFAFRLVMTAIFWGKKKSVPPIRNTQLLKPATQLAKEIRERKLKSEEVVRTYINRVLEVEPFINAVVQDNFDVAIKKAKEVDALIATGKFTTEELAEEKPLLGVPFTVKCLFKVKGFHDTAGSLLYKGRIAKVDAPPIALLKAAGGIFLATTNSAELGTGIETNNKLYGKTTNPYDVTRTCGGSTGGEAALVGAAGSVIGLGNDLYGSLRMPAHYCGLFAHKPSKDLISQEGNFVTLPPFAKMLYAAGPICRYSEDLFTVMKVLSMNKKEIDLMKRVDFKNIKIYYQTRIKNAWVFHPDKEIVQAIQNAALHFKKNYDTTIEEINNPLLSKSNAIMLNSFGNRILSLIESVTEGKQKNMNGIVELIKMFVGKCRLTLAVIIVSTCCFKWPFFHNKNLATECDRMYEELKTDFDRLLDKNSVFLFPTLPTTAPYHSEVFTSAPSTCYTGVFNLLELPVTQCPMGFNKEGLPLGIQIVGQKRNDALTLSIAVELEKAFGGWSPP